MISHLRWLLPVVVLVILPVACVGAATVPFVEGFDDDAANWRDESYALLTHHDAGGPDGSSYVSGTFAFAGLTVDDIGTQLGSPLVIRGESVNVIDTELIASDGALFGNWLTDGVAEFRLMVRHSAPEPLTMYARFAANGNFPYVIANIAEPVPSNTWTELVIPIRADNPQWTYHVAHYPYPFPFSPSGVGVIQFGVDMPASLAGNPSVFSLDIDSVGLYPVPEPSGWASLSLLALALFATRRQWRSAAD